MQRFVPTAVAEVPASMDDSDSETEDVGAAASHRAKPRRKAHQRPQGSDQIRQAFSKRKKGLVLKSYQLFRLTDAKVFMFVVNDKGSSWAYSTPGFGAPLGLPLLRQLRDMAGVGDIAGQSKCHTEVMAHPSIADHSPAADDRDNYVTPRSNGPARSTLTEGGTTYATPAARGGGGAAGAGGRACSSFSNASGDVELSVAGGAPGPEGARARGQAARALSVGSKPRGPAGCKAEDGDDHARGRPPSGMSASTLGCAAPGIPNFTGLPIPLPLPLPGGDAGACSRGGGAAFMPLPDGGAFPGPASSASAAQHHAPQHMGVQAPHGAAAGAFAPPCGEQGYPMGGMLDFMDPHHMAAMQAQQHGHHAQHTQHAQPQQQQPQQQFGAFAPGGGGGGGDAFGSLQARLPPLRTRAVHGWPDDGGSQVHSAPASMLNPLLGPCGPAPGGVCDGGAAGALHADTMSDYGYAPQAHHHAQPQAYAPPAQVVSTPGPAAPPNGGAAAAAFARFGGPAAAARFAGGGGEPSPTASIGRGVAALAVDSAPGTPSGRAAAAGAGGAAQQAPCSAPPAGPGAGAGAGFFGGGCIPAPQDGDLGSPDEAFLDDPILAGLWADAQQQPGSLPPPLLHQHAQLPAMGAQQQQQHQYQMHQVAAQLQALQHQQAAMQQAMQHQHMFLQPPPAQQQQQPQQPHSQQPSPRGGAGAPPAAPSPALAAAAAASPAARERLLDALSAQISAMSPELRVQLQAQIEASSPQPCGALADAPPAGGGAHGGGGGQLRPQAAGGVPGKRLHGPSRLSANSPAVPSGSDAPAGAAHAALAAAGPPAYIVPSMPPPGPGSPAGQPQGDCPSPLKRGGRSLSSDGGGGSPLKRMRGRGPHAFGGGAGGGADDAMAWALQASINGTVADAAAAAAAAAAGGPGAPVGPDGAACHLPGGDWPPQRAA